ncbi:MAG: tRNA (adenosine(37)-N6)-threonylcarbamoyltransferase complex ATPase subunit type 1 TsaE [Synergistaceae bacterium]|nr:tRNA (adenosine(37)-N6)-threonylcarbamoyltransferase complex ATPase subunit type 1 TsaE [Synergistaceae bacterium]
MTQDKIFISHSENETLELGRRVAKNLFGGLVILLYGDLGTGKTVFVRGVCEELNISGVRSPSFTLINEYESKNFVVIHADLYRLDEKSANFIGLEEYCGINEFVVFIEWPERLPGIISDNIINVKFSALNESEREIKFSGQGLKAEGVISKL